MNIYSIQFSRVTKGRIQCYFTYLPVENIEIRTILFFSTSPASKTRKREREGG